VGAEPIHAGLEIVVGLVDAARVLAFLDLFRAQQAPAQGLFPGEAAYMGMVADRLGGDVARPGQGFGGRGYLGGEEVCGDFLQGLRRAHLLQDQVGQVLQAPFSGDAGPGAALGLVGLVEVLQRRERRGGADLLLQFGGEFALCGDAGEDGLAPLVQGPQFGQ